MAAQPVPGALFQSGGTPVKLEVMARELGSREFHFYVADADFADLVPLIGRSLAQSQALIFKMPPGLLNPNYWEPHTKAGEDAVRARHGGVITRDDGGASWLWRSDSIAPGRLLRDGIDIPVELVDGAAFKTRGSDLLKLGQAWMASGAAATDRFEWAAFGPPAPNDGAGGVSTDAREDLGAFRVRTAGVTMIFAAAGDRKMRMAITDRAILRALARAAMRGYMMRCAGRVVSPPNDRVCDQFIGHAGRGLSSTPERDFVSKRVAFEFTAWPGRTPWTEPGTEDTASDEERVLVYYDRVAGIWAVAS